MQNVEHDGLSYLKLFLDDSVMTRIVNETNRYAEQCQQQNSRPFSHTNRWEPITVDDLWVFFGILILQGVIGKPVQQWYWSTNKLLETPIFCKIMTLCCFTLITKYLHFTNNDEYDAATHPYPKLHKVWDVHDMIRNNFTNVYVPDQDISTYESLMAYKGRLSWIQYIASKRA